MTLDSRPKCRLALGAAGRQGSTMTLASRPKCRLAFGRRGSRVEPQKSWEPRGHWVRMPVLASESHAVERRPLASRVVIRHACSTASLLFFLFLPVLARADVQAPGGLAAEPGKPGHVAIPTLPLAFVPNAGQLDARVRYYGRGPGYSIYFTPEEASLVFAQRPTLASSTGSAAT